MIAYGLLFLTTFITVYLSIQEILQPLMDATDTTKINEKYLGVINHLRIEYSAISFVLSLTFMVFGILNISLLKTNFPEFYLKNGKKLKFATVGLSVPLMFRVLLEGFQWWLTDKASEKVIHYMNSIIWI